LLVVVFAGTTIGMTPLLSDRIEASKRIRRNNSVKSYRKIPSISRWASLRNSVCMSYRLTAFSRSVSQLSTSLTPNAVWSIQMLLPATFMRNHVNVIERPK